MKKYELLKIMNNELLDKLFGFCYARTSDSYEAQELCSDILFALVRAAGGEGEIAEPYPFIWRVARNVYADFCEKRKKQQERFCQEDTEELLLAFAAEEPGEDEELLRAVYRRMAFLTRAYREAMILYYLDGLSTAEIAKRQNTSEVAIRQRLFSARKKIKSEVEKMAENQKPMVLERKEYEIVGTGNPGWGDPRNACNRQFSKHVVWLCRKKPMSAVEIAEELNVPTAYVEEELDILAWGENGKYGLLRRMDNGKYFINFVLLAREEMEEANRIYKEHLSIVSDVIIQYVQENKEKYLAFPYLNRKVDFNLVLWQQITSLAEVFANTVEKKLKEKYFCNVERVNRDFSVFGYENTGKHYGCGSDGTSAENICGYSKVHLINIYISRIKAHFRCMHNISLDKQLQLTIRAINGLAVEDLTEEEREQAAKAIECGYLYRDGNMLYTKILVSPMRETGCSNSVGTFLRDIWKQMLKSWQKRWQNS